jgi:phosphoribosylformimino-5-aminoimidazole carboxamide ribotide isomerase
MILFPAIDIYRNQVVRLKKGDYQAVTVYHDSPVEQAKLFEVDGATWVHIVDLEGSKTGIISVIDVLRQIKDTTSLKIQFGGGIRNSHTVETLIKLGVDSIVLGSFAVKEYEALKTLCFKYPNHMTVAVDVKDDIVYYQGWQEESRYTLFDFLDKMTIIGVKKVMITDIKKDGMLEGLHISWYQKIKNKYPNLHITASGGVTTLNDIKELSKVDLYGAIVGVSLYEKKIDLKEAIRCLKDVSFPV